MKLNYILKVIDEDTDETIVKLSSSSGESLMEDMGKSKLTEAIKKYKESTSLVEILEEETHISGECNPLCNVCKEEMH